MALRRNLLLLLLLALALAFTWAHRTAESRPTGTRIEVHFSPGGGVMRAVSAQIRGARTSVDAGLYLISHPQLATDLIAAHKRGVAVRVIVDGRMNRRYSKVNDLVENGVAVWKLFLEKGPEDFSTPQYHHKFAVIDGTTVVTGSFNWTRMADESNHENLLVVRDPDLAARYTEQFEAALELGERAETE